MAAYLIAQIEVTDPERYQEYRSKVVAVIEKHGGRFIVRGPEVTVLEGRHDRRRLVIIEFPSMDHVQAFYRSPEYRPLIELRQTAATGDIWAVPGT